MPTRKEPARSPDRDGSSQRGPRADRGEIAERILVAARRCFAENGYAGTTLRLVAAAAGVDPSLVNYYFTNKDRLLRAVLEPPAGFAEGIAKASAAPLRTRGQAMVGAMLGMWEQPDAADILRSIILTAAHEPIAMERLRTVFADQILAAVSENLDGDERALRAGMVASQIVGLVMTRYVWRIGAVAHLSRDEVVRLFAPTVQRYLTGRLPPVG